MGPGGHASPSIEVAARCRATRPSALRGSGRAAQPPQVVEKLAIPKKMMNPTCNLPDVSSKLSNRERRQLVDVSWGWVDGFGPSIGVALVMRTDGFE